MIFKKQLIVLQISQSKISVNSESGLEVPWFNVTKLYQNLAVGCTTYASSLFLNDCNLDPEE